MRIITVIGIGFILVNCANTRDSNDIYVSTIDREMYKKGGVTFDDGTEYRFEALDFTSDKNEKYTITGVRGYNSDDLKKITKSTRIKIVGNGFNRIDGRIQLETTDIVLVK